MRATLALFKRSVWKGPNIVPFEINNTIPANKHPIIRTQKRAATITPQLVGYRFAVHNGKIYQDVFVTEEMVGRKLGEFVP
ncbi:37S ribosomal protein S19, mitochondrial [Cyphellophora attinorum]|uniref:37S ribosomal protein S19, mitochondrial n=1 Tax=Cyphellophora attinorum TaxID=1664694 RepID=A0A0N1NY79_9EURO|nr:37S ribosomal protein S19, mitochondrial [Phialophora attinorum]KPI38252.1 37S ribosomal protein S19, mitochondrial [Phialophora attinorum]